MSLSPPSNELIQYWHSSTANVQDSANYIGIKNPAVDDLVMKVVNAEDRESLVTAARALDRIMLFNWYVIPHWYIGTYRIAYWNKFSRPAISPKYDPSYNTSLFTWWVDNKKLMQLEQARKN